jgi:hypothetical protein
VLIIINTDLGNTLTLFIVASVLHAFTDDSLRFEVEVSFLKIAICRMLFGEAHAAACALLCALLIFLLQTTF